MSLSTADRDSCLLSVSLISEKMLIVETVNEPIAITQRKRIMVKLVETTVSEVSICELFTIYKFE